MIPKILKDAQLFVEGIGYAGKAKEIALPKLTRKTEEFIAGGMLGPVELDYGLEKLEASFTLCEWPSHIIDKIAEKNVAGISAKLLSAFERDVDNSHAERVTVLFRGRFKEFDFGTINPREMAPLKVAMNLAYYKYSTGIDNPKDIYEADLIDGVEKVNGVDVNAARNKAIGR